MRLPLLLLLRLLLGDVRVHFLHVKRPCLRDDAVQTLRRQRARLVLSE